MEQVFVIKVFVASPSDMENERERVKDVIDELNLTHADGSGLRMELVRWETHTRPEIGEDAQSVINQQIDDDYDVFVGILGSRFGTPTRRAGSGTEEEFQNAVARKQEDESSVKIMMYFKDVAPRINEIDITQLQRVIEFRKVVEEMGLSSHFDSTDEFERLSRLHLSRVFREFADKKIDLIRGRTTTESTPPLVLDQVEAEAPEEDENEELGYFDWFDIYEDKLGIATRAMNEIAALGISFNDTLSNTNNRLIGADQRKLRREIDLLASAMADYSKKMANEVEVYWESFNLGMDAFSHAFSTRQEFSNPDVEEIEEISNDILGIRKNVAELGNSITHLKECINGLPRLTRELNKAKRDLAELMTSYEEKVRASENLLDEAHRFLGTFKDIQN